MKSVSNNIYGSFLHPNDVETNKSKYMYEFAATFERYTERHLRLLVRQRMALDVIIVSAGAFLVAYSLRHESPPV
jgi:hypothetical protein